MKQIISICIFMMVAIAISAQQIDSAYIHYIEQWRDTALAHQAEFGIPASITLAQGLLESGAGKSDLATEANNHFGIKCHEWGGKTYLKDDDKKDDCFRVYEDASASYRDHSLFLKRTRYQKLYEIPITDYAAWAHGLKSCGYATDPKYPDKLIHIIETYGLDKLDDKQSPKAIEKTNRQNNVNKDTSRSIASKGSVTELSGNSAIVTEEELKTWHGSQFRDTKLNQTYRRGKNNGVKYLLAHDGDTYERIALVLGMSEKLLLKYNDSHPGQELHEGDYVYLCFKKSKAAKQYKRHLVRPGETAWSISQQYGIRMKSLYKINGIDYGIKLTTQQYLDLR